MNVSRILVLAWFVLACTALGSAEVPSQPIALKEGWSEQQLAAFTAGCVLAIIEPAKRDYAVAATRAGNSSPKPFPEAEFRDSVTPMCRCLSVRIAETWSYFNFITDSQAKSRPLIDEALRGGRCKPEGILGQLLSRQRKQ